MAQTEIENRATENGMAVFFVAVWGVILIAAFVWYRGSDVGQLPVLITNLGDGRLFGSAAVDSLIGFVVSVLMLQAWVGLGRFICSFILTANVERRSVLLEFSINASVGAAIWSLIFFFLGLAGAYVGIVALIAVALGGLLLFVRRQTLSIAGNMSWRNLSSVDWVIVLLIAIPVVLAAIASLAPPVAKDTLLYHYALPKAYVAQHSNAFIEGNIASYLPLGTEMHFVWAMLLGGLFDARAGEAAAGGVSYWVFILLICAIYGWARELRLDKSWALLAAVIVATVPTVYHVAVSGYVDVALSLFVALSVYALSRWWESEGNGWLVLVGIFLGSALSIKLTSIFIFAAFALVMLLRARKGKNELRLLAVSLGALILAVVFASPWYLRTWRETGSPVFPFYMSIWNGHVPNWDVERSNLFQTMNSQYGGASKSPVDYLISPWSVSVTAQPEQPKYFDGVMGVSFLFGLPLLLWALWRFDLGSDVKIGAGVAGIMFLLWLSSSQQLRYLLPVLPLLAIAVVAAARTASGQADVLRSSIMILLGAASFIGLLTIVSWFCQTAPLRVVLGGEDRDKYLARNLDYYQYYQWLNKETEATDKVWLINMRRDTYNLERPAVSDYLFEDWTLRRMIWESGNDAELRAKASGLGVRYVLTRHDFLFDYTKSTIVDDKRPRTENESKLRIAREFILDPARTIKADDKFSLIKVF